LRFRLSSSDQVILSVLYTEKVLKMVEKENKIIFVVDKRASKADIKRSVERAFNVRVESVNTLITPKGEKRAIVKLKPEYKATELATKLGML
jgi:large subunit ribosomal protein L23